MPDELEQPFSSLESAIEFMQVLAETILEARRELDQEHLKAESNGRHRRAQAIALAVFKLKTLNGHVYKSRRALNDLRILRRLILNERSTVKHAIATM